MVGKQHLHDPIRMRSPVVNIPHHMQAVHRKTLDQRCKRNHIAFRLTDINNGCDDVLIVRLFIVFLAGGM